MSESWAGPSGRAPFADPAAEVEQTGAGDLPKAAQYGLALVFVGLAAVLAFVVDHLVAAPNLTLIFVLPVVVSSVAFGWGPALAAALGGVLAFDFFFTRPYFSFRMTEPSEIWAAALLLVIATIVSSVAAESRRRALVAQQAAERATALQGLAHLVIDDRPEWEVMRSAAAVLNRAFRAPAVILLKHGESFAPVASAGEANLTEADREAARAALEAHVATHGGAYPYDASGFDFWPVAVRGEMGWVIGVGFLRSRQERPLCPERFVDVVRGYVAAAIAANAARGGPHG